MAANVATKRISKMIWERLRELCSGDKVLEEWLHQQDVLNLMYVLIDSLESPDELGKKLKEIIDSLPRYIKLVKIVLELEKLYKHAVKDLAKDVVEVFKSLEPLSSKGLRQTEIKNIYVDDWIKIKSSPMREPEDIDALINDVYVIGLLAEDGDEIAKYIDDEDKRETFLKLVELARKLRLGRDDVCGSKVSTVYYHSPEGPVKVEGELCVRLRYASYLYIRGTTTVRIHVPDLPNMLTLIPIMNEVEELYDRLYKESERMIDNNERIREEMRNVATPYIIAKMLG